LAQRYCEYALGCFEKLQSILRSRPAGKVLVQVVVEDAGEQAVLAGLAGLLKTAGLENPKIAGQLVLVPAGTTAGELAGWMGAEKSRSNGGVDAQVRYRQRQRQVLRWEEAGAQAEKPPMAFKE